jgi:hypothetical protein
MKAAVLPQFHSIGSPRGDFYVLAFVRGLYVPSARTKDEAFLVLNYSPAKAFTKFSFVIISPDGELRAYKRGLNEHDSIESALLTAWYEYNVAPHFWLPFPKSEATQQILKSKHAKQYSEVKGQFCSLLEHFRMAAWSKTAEYAKRFELKHPVQPMFRFKKMPTAPNPLELNTENEEIANSAFEYFQRNKKAKP